MERVNGEWVEPSTCRSCLQKLRDAPPPPPAEPRPTFRELWHRMFPPKPSPPPLRGALTEVASTCPRGGLTPVLNEEGALTLTDPDPPPGEPT
jgi:hypothetical protein